MSPTTLLSAVALMAIAAVTVAAADTQQHCYYPDGTNADSGTSPCNTTAAVSACCDPRDSCTTGGLCLGASGWIYRSACTDQTWRSDSCPAQCQIDPNLDAAYSSFAPIYACTPGQFPTKFCCGGSGAGPEPDCCASNFTLGNTGLAFKPGTDAVVARLSSLSAALASATAHADQTTGGGATATASATTSAVSSPSSTSSSSSTGHNLGTAIGVGVGVPLGILALGVIGFLVWRERRRRPGMVVDAVSPVSVYSGVSRAQLVGQPPVYQVNTPQAGWKEVNSQNGHRPSPGGGGGGGFVREVRTVDVSHELQS